MGSQACPKPDRSTLLCFLFSFLPLIILQICDLLQYTGPIFWEGFPFLLSSQILPARFPSKLLDGSGGADPHFNPELHQLHFKQLLPFPENGKSSSASRHKCTWKAGSFFAMSTNFDNLKKARLKSPEPPSCVSSHLSASPSIFLPVLLPPPLALQEHLTSCIRQHLAQRDINLTADPWLFFKHRP